MTGVADYTAGHRRLSDDVTLAVRTIHHGSPTPALCCPLPIATVHFHLLPPLAHTRDPPHSRLRPVSSPASPPSTIPLPPPPYPPLDPSAPPPPYTFTFRSEQPGGPFLPPLGSPPSFPVLVLANPPLLHPCFPMPRRLCRLTHQHTFPAFVVALFVLLGLLAWTGIQDFSSLSSAPDLQKALLIVSFFTSAGSGLHSLCAFYLDGGDGTAKMLAQQRSSEDSE